MPRLPSGSILWMMSRSITRFSRDSPSDLCTGWRMPSQGHSEFGIDSGSQRSRYGQSGRIRSASAVSSPMNGLIDTRYGISFSSLYNLPQTAVEPGKVYTALSEYVKY